MELMPRLRRKVSRRTFFAVLAPLLTLGALALGYWISAGRSRDPIRVGVLHSLSGTMAISERAVVDATLLAIDDVNRTGGVLGRRVEAVVRDGRSDWPTFAHEAERLILQDRVAVTFGCWTSACRKQLKPIVEEHRHLLFYPLQYEGLEQSPYIVYTGAAPNQQIIPAVRWAVDNLGSRFYLVGSDYVFPRTANAIIRHVVEILGGTIVGEDYLPLGSRDTRSIVEGIQRARPAVILNTVNGDTNVAFFEELRQAGITPDDVPTMSFSVAETELSTMNPDDVAGNYAAWNYFQSVPRDENRTFLSRLHTTYGTSRVAADPMEAAYVGVHLWALAVNDARSTEADAVRRALGDQSYSAPEGVVYVDPETQHTWKRVRIGKIRHDGQFDIVWDSGKPVRPAPYPPYRSRAEWDAFLQAMYEGWRGWANPAVEPSRTSRASE
jgi:urea transport system substrate-binding protein